MVLARVGSTAVEVGLAGAALAAGAAVGVPWLNRHLSPCLHDPVLKKRPHFSWAGAAGLALKALSLD
eukprot:4871689-Heterocapsa_arctica.AAC.1